MSITPEQQKPGLMRRKWFQALIIFGVLGIGVAGSRILIETAPKAEKRAPQKKARLVEDIQVSPTNAKVELIGYGVVEAEQQVALQARVSGTVQSVAPVFVPGQTVSKGQTLLTLDDTDYQLEYANARASLAQAEAALAQEQGNQAVAQADYELLGLEVSEREKQLILRQPQLASAKAAVASAKAAVDRARVNLERTKIKAPFDGIIVSRLASTGSQVSPTTSLGQIASNRAYWVNVAVPQQDLKWLQFPAAGIKGSTVCVSDASLLKPEDCHPGKVLNLQGYVQDNGRQAQVLVEVKADPANTDSPLLLSQYVRVVFEGKTLNGVYKLDPSLLHEDKIWINNNGVLQVQAVNTVFRAQDHVLVDSGLEPGQHVITSNLSAAVDGMAIRTADTPETNTKAEPAKP